MQYFAVNGYGLTPLGDFTLAEDADEEAQHRWPFSMSDVIDENTAKEWVDIIQANI